MSTLSDDLRTLSYEAALYFYPLVMMDVTRLQAINSPGGHQAGIRAAQRVSSPQGVSDRGLPRRGPAELRHPVLAGVA